MMTRLQKAVPSEDQQIEAFFGAIRLIVREELSAALTAPADDVKKSVRAFTVVESPSDDHWI